MKSKIASEKMPTRRYAKWRPENLYCASAMCKTRIALWTGPTSGNWLPVGGLINRLSQLSVRFVFVSDPLGRVAN